MLPEGVKSAGTRPCYERMTEGMDQGLVSLLDMRAFIGHLPIYKKDPVLCDPIRQKDICCRSYEWHWLTLPGLPTEIANKVTTTVAVSIRRVIQRLIPHQWQADF